MISHGNLIDSVSQIFVVTAGALKVNPVRISLIKPPHHLIRVVKSLRYGTAWVA